MSTPIGRTPHAADSSRWAACVRASTCPFSHSPMKRSSPPSTSSSSASQITCEKSIHHHRAPLFPESHVQGILRAKKLSRLELTSNGDASLTMRLRSVLFNPFVFTQSWKTRSSRQVFRTSTCCGTPRVTAEYHCLASDVRQRHVFLSGLGKTSGSGGSVGWSLYRAEHMSLQQIQCEMCLQPSC